MELDRTDEYYRVCPNCGNEFMAKHLNRRYCNETCKRRHERRKISDKRKRTKHHDDILHKNLQILDSLKIGESKTITSKYLESIGFNTEVFTNLITDEDDEERYAIQVYDYILKQNSDKEYLIIKTD